MATSLHVVIGAGPVGTAVTRLLTDSGSRVRLITRSGSGPDHPDVERVRLDVANEADATRLTELSENASAIYNCANPPYHRWAQDWPPIAAALLAAAESSGAVLATCSNLYGYGPTDAALSEPGLHEDLPLAAAGTKGRVRAQMWRDALAAHRAGRIRATEVRGSDYLGATAASMVGDSVVPNLLRGRTARVLGDPALPHTFTFTGDVARLLVTTAADERAWGRAWHVPSHPPVRIEDLVGELAAHLDVPTVPVRQIPAWLIRVAGLVNPMAREFDEVAHQHTRPWHLDSSAARSTFGLDPTPWGDVLDAHLACYRTLQRTA